MMKGLKIFAILAVLLLVAPGPCIGQQYECRTGRSCRCSSSDPCEHTSYYGLSIGQCRVKCNDEGDGCKGYEWTNNESDSDDEDHCEIHEVAGNRYNDVSQDRSDTVCCWRVTSTPDSKDTKSGKRQRDRARNFLRNLHFENKKKESDAEDDNFF
mmetsp:Transcript_9806/g.27471  ORF Transcript_9806/g.27471 Transcript_9806/m.27471 type:complete len:155 (-) Transcript_9806:106-570(-)